MPEPDAPLLDGLEPEITPSPKLLATNPVEDFSDRSVTIETSIFQSLESLPSDSDSDSEPEPDLNVNDTWANLMLELDTLRIKAGGRGGKARGKKGKGYGIVLETPEMRRLKDKICKVEREYLFSRKDAGT